jgi:hypothetical protein
MNPIVCSSCDGEDVLDRWVARCYEAWTKFWWVARDDQVSKHEPLPKAFARMQEIDSMYGERR